MERSRYQYSVERDLAVNGYINEASIERERKREVMRSLERL